MEKRKFTPRPKEKKEFEETVISINRVVKVTKGGRNLRFSAAVVIGDKKGRVGLGTGKANEVPDAIKKAINDAKQNIVNVPIIDGRTISHDAIGTSGAAKVLIKPASAGTGVKAGGAVRAILEMAGVNDVISKSLGSNTKLNVARATLDALIQQRTVEQIATLRGKTKEEIIG